MAKGQRNSNPRGRAADGAMESAAGYGETQMVGNRTTSAPNTLQAYAPIIQKGFAARLEHDRKIEALTNKHLKPVKDLRKEDWDQLAVDCQMDKADLELDYKKFKRQETAKTLDEEDRERILENMRILHYALHQGGMLDFIDALEADYQPKRLAQDAAMIAGAGDDAAADAAALSDTKH